MLTTVFIVAVLSVLEVSLSFDNAVVNATVLEHMDAVWRRRFITWGIAIAVFGMRIVFPLVIVAVIAQIGPIAALVLAATDPDEYSRILTSAHVSVSAFGGAFLAMVGLKHFFDIEKDVHWIEVIERPLTQLGRIEAVELGLVLMLLWLVGRRAARARAGVVPRRRAFSGWSPTSSSTASRPCSTPDQWSPGPRRARARRRSSTSRCSMRASASTA